MTPDDIQAALDTQDSLRLSLADGQQYDILDPLTVHVGVSAILVGVYDAGSDSRVGRCTRSRISSPSNP